MNTYLRTLIFKIDNKEYIIGTKTILVNEEEELLKKDIIANGKTFESLWTTMNDYGLAIPANRWDKTFFSKKRKIEFFKCIKTWIDNGIEREWELYRYDKPIKLSMEELMKFNSDDVIQYLTERKMKLLIKKS